MERKQSKPSDNELSAPVAKAGAPTGKVSYDISYNTIAVRFVEVPNRRRKWRVWWKFWKY
jgi:hypothetical protein